MIHDMNYLCAASGPAMTTTAPTTFTPATGLLASFDLLQVSHGGGVMHVRLNRPAKRNALSTR
jgi:hypothetical protein